MLRKEKETLEMLKWFKDNKENLEQLIKIFTYETDDYTDLMYQKNFYESKNKNIIKS